ncbi:hypothetical protein SAMN04488528_100378 [Clostridium frigidicarnis]|uniref:Uncharacterized protein n=1 Tax=Clostridium frigidicarnis TaxID=84698 RepID=A0A1I0VWE4_9CLOT|nr:hypothetical protein SAMN04488528_100378 [Clostridium frigidicarnis]
MEKNKDNTVVLVDLIFNDPISLIEVGKLKTKYDVDFPY